MSAHEGYTLLNGGPVGAPVSGGKRHHKLKLVTRKQARKALKKLHMKMRGGAEAGAVVADAKTSLPVVTGGGEEVEGGRRRHKRRGGTKRRSASRRRSASMFGL